MTFYFKQGTTFDRLANGNTGTSNTASAGVTVYDASYVYPGVNTTFALQTALDTQQSFTNSFVFTSITGTVSSAGTTASTSLYRDKVSYTMPVTSITGTLNAGTATIGNNITITGTSTFFNTKLPSSNTYRRITGYDGAGNPIYAYYSSTLLIANLPITGTVTIAAQTPVAPDYRLYISGTGTRFLSDLLVTGSNTSTGVLNETLSPIVQPGQSTPTILVDNVQIDGAFSWTSNGTVITGAGSKFLSQLSAGASITLLKPISGRLTQTDYIPASVKVFNTLQSYSVNNTNPTAPAATSIAIMYGVTSTCVWVCPAGTTSINVVCIGTGGNGVTTTTSLGLYSGGGGGGLGWYRNFAVTPGSSYTVNIGLPSAVSGGNGGDTWFSATTTVRGTGGIGGGTTRAGGTFNGQGGGSGGAGGIGSAGSTGGGGGGGAGGYWGTGGAGGVGYDTTYAAGSGGTAPGAGSVGAGKSAGGGGGGQLTTQTVPLGRGGAVDPYYATTNSSALVTAAAVSAGSPGSHGGNGVVQDYFFGNGGTGGAGGTITQGNAQGGYGVCFIEYVTTRPFDWAGSSLTNRIVNPTTSAGTRYLAKTNISSPFPIYLTDPAISYTSLSVFSAGFVSFGTTPDTYFGELTYGAFPHLDIAGSNNQYWHREVDWQVEGATPNRKLKIHYLGAIQLGGQININQYTPPAITSYDGGLASKDNQLAAYYNGSLIDYSMPHIIDSAQSFSTPSSLTTNFSGNGFNTYWSSTLLGAAALTASTTPTSGTTTNGYWAVTSPFAINFYGSSYTNLYISHNSRIGFGDWRGADIPYGYGKSDLTTDSLRGIGTDRYPTLPSLSIFRTTDYFGAPTLSFTGSASTTIAIGENFDPASCQRIYYGTEGTAPNRRFRIRYEGDSSLSTTVGNSKYIWEITFFESSYGMSSSSAFKHGTFAIANGTKGELLRKFYYYDPAQLKNAEWYEIGYMPVITAMNGYRNESSAWNNTSRTTVANWSSSIAMQVLMIMAQSSTALTSQTHSYYNWSQPSLAGQPYYYNIIYTNFIAAGSYYGVGIGSPYGWPYGYPTGIVYDPAGYSGAPNGSNSSNLSIITTRAQNIYNWDVNWEVTIPENSAAGFTIAAGTFGTGPAVSYFNTGNGYSLREADGATVATYNFQYGYDWWQRADAGAALNIVVPVIGTTPPEDKLNLPPANYPYSTYNLYLLPGGTQASAERYSTVPATGGNPIFVKTQSSTLEGIYVNYTFSVSSPLLDPLYDENYSVTPNSVYLYGWNVCSSYGPINSNLTSNLIYSGYGGLMSNIARWPQDGYNATAALANPNPTCVPASKWATIGVDITSVFSPGGKFGGGSWTYTYNYNHYNTSNSQNWGYLFSYGSSAATHSRFLMSRTTFGRFHNTDVQYRVSNQYKAISFSTSPNEDGNVTHANVFAWSSNGSIISTNPGIGEDLELWYHSSPEPQPPTAGQSPAVLGWVKYSTLYAPAGTANASLPRTPYTFPNEGGRGTANAATQSFNPTYNTWLIWQKSFATQTTSNARLSEYMIETFVTRSRNHISYDTYIYTGNANSSNTGRLKLEVTSGTTLRIPTLTSKNSPVWGSYADYLVAENPADHSYGMAFTSLIPLSSTTTSTPNASYINSWSTGGTTSYGQYWPGLQSVPAYIVETRTIASISNDTTLTVTAPMKSTSFSYWGGGDPSTGAATRTFAIDRVYSNTSMSVVAPFGLPGSSIGTIATSAVNRTATADRRFTIVSIASATSMTVSGGGIYAPFTAKTSTFPQRESGLFTITGYHDGSNLTANTTWVSGGVPGIDQFGVYYGAEYLSTTRAQIGNTSFAIISINSNTSITLSGVAITSNFYDQSLQFRWSAPSSTITMIGTGTKFLPDTAGNITTKQIQVYSSSDVRIGRIFIGSSSFSVVGIANDTTMTVSGFVSAGFTGATVSAYRETITYAVGRTLASTGTATWDKTGTAIGVDDSLVVQPYDVDFGIVTELFNTTSDALLYAAQQLVVGTSITVADATSSILLLVTWMKDFYTNSPYESSNTLDINISSIGTFTVAYDDELQRNYKDYAGGRTLMYSGLSYITTSNALTISSTTITGATTSTAVINWIPANRLRSGTYGRLVAKLSNLTNTSVSIIVDAGSTGWSSATEDFLNITVIGAD